MDLNKIVADEVTKAFSQINFSDLVMREVIKQLKDKPILHDFFDQMNKQMAKQHSEKTLRENLLRDLDQGKEDAKGYLSLDRTITKTYLKNKYHILDVEENIEIIADKAIDLGVIFSYEKENPFYSEIPKIVEKLQDNHLKSTQFSIQHSAEDFRLSDRFYQPNYMISILKEDGSTYPVYTEACIETISDNKTNEQLNAISIRPQKEIQFPIGTRIKIFKSYSLPNSIFTTTPFPDQIHFSSLSAYTNIKVQEEIYGNRNACLHPVFKQVDNGKIIDTIESKVNIYYKYYMWEFFYNPKRKDVFQLDVIRTDK